jgi:hypothetical protein
LIRIAKTATMPSAPVANHYFVGDSQHDMVSSARADSDEAYPRRRPQSRITEAGRQALMVEPAAIDACTRMEAEIKLI